MQGCARFPEILQNVSERQILCSLCSVVFHAFTLILPIQTSLSVLPELPVCLRSGENCPNFSKTNTPQRNQMCSPDLTVYLSVKPLKKTACYMLHNDCRDH